MGGAVAIFFILGALSRPGEGTAKFVPASAPLYISVNLRPGMNQLKRLQEVRELLETDDFLDRQDELLDRLEDDTDIHFLDDVLPWVGTDVSFVVLEAELDRPEWALLAQVGDRGAADDFLNDLADYLEDELGSEYDNDRRRGSDLWLSNYDGEIALALTEDYLLIADSEDTVLDMIDNINSPPSRPLAESQPFIEARESLPSERVMFAFLQSREAIDAIEEEYDPDDEDEEEVFRQARNNIPEYVAASASFIDQGIRIDMVGETPSRAFSLGTDEQIRSPEALPADTVAMVAVVGVESMWQELRDSIENLDPYTEEEFEEFLEDLEDGTGIDLERDVIDSLSGEAAVALLSSDFSFRTWNDGSDEIGVVQGLILAGVEDPDGIADALDQIADEVEDAGFDVDQSRLDEYEMVTVRGEDQFSEFEPGYLVTGEWAAVGSDVSSLEAFHDATTGATDTLSSNDDFSRLIDMVSSPHHLLLFANLEELLDIVDDALDDDDRSIYRREVEPFVGQLGFLLLTGAVTSEEMRFSLVLTLRE